jgi:hypothetical protein
MAPVSDVTTNVDLSGAKMNHAILSGARLSGADLTNADLSGTLLFYTNLTNANLSDANLTGARLFHVNLTGAHLNTAVGLTQAQLDETCGELANLPAGLTLNKPCPASVVPPLNPRSPSEDFLWHLAESNRAVARKSSRADRALPSPRLRLN